MKRRIVQCGNIREQLILPGMEALLSSVDLGDSRQRSQKHSKFDPTWVDTPPEIDLKSVIDDHHDT